MNLDYLNNLAQSIDPLNAEYILKDEDILGTYRVMGRFLKEGRKGIALDILKDLKRKITVFKDQRLLPSNVKVGDGVTVNLWTDRYAATIVKITRCSLTVRRDRAILDPDWKPEWIPGGFSAHCINNDEQMYIAYEPDEKGTVYTIRWSDKYQRYGRPGNLTLSKGRHEFYDYNF